MDLASFLNAKQIKDLARVISEAELLTSGEIRLHLEEKCEIETEARALEVFYSLNMGNTKLKNAVLLYISYGDQKFAICGDEGIHKNVSNRFWKSLKNSLKRAFEKKDFFNGISVTIMECGRQLRTYFPYQHDDINELENHVTFEKDLK